MKTGDLVRWSLAWLAGCNDGQARRDTSAGIYRKQIGVLIEAVNDPPNCWLVVWSNGQVGHVHREYMEVI
jgi:hypothetical protein